MHIVFHKPALFIPALIFPLFFYMAFAGGLSGVSNIPGFDYYDYNAFQFIFVLLQSAAFGGVFIGFSIGADFDSGFTRRLFAGRGRPLGGRSPAYGMAALVRAVMVWASCSRSRSRPGWRSRAASVDLVGLFWLAVVVNLAALPVRRRA